MAFDISYFGLSSEALPAGWREDRLDTIADFNPEQVSKDYPHMLIEYLDISNVGKGMIGKSEFLALENAPSRAKRIVTANDTIISTVRPGNRAYAFLKEIPPNLIVSTGFAVLRAKGSSPRFLYYLSTSDPIIDYLTSIAEEKTAYPSVNPGDIAECHVPIPTIPEQKAIAHILGTLDDKIEMNRRMNETLEAMARAIFKSWFVDFDPIPGHGPHKEWQDSPLGRIPKGWEVVSFASTVEISGGGTPKTSVPEYWGGDIPWYTVGDAPRGSEVYVIDTGKKITKAGVENSATRILPTGSTIISARGTVGKLAMTGVPMAMNQTCYGLQGKISNSSAYTFFSTLNLITTLQQRTHGSVFDTITRDTLASVEVVLPSSKIIERFEVIVAPVMEHILNNLWQSRTLAAIRDVLLPKLLSGEIRVKDAVKFLEAHV